MSASSGTQDLSIAVSQALGDVLASAHTQARGMSLEEFRLRAKSKSSPNHKYGILMESKEWRVVRWSDQKVIFTRHYAKDETPGHQNYTFFTREGVDWLQLTGSYITYQTFINLETGAAYNNDLDFDEEGELITPPLSDVIRVSQDIEKLKKEDYYYRGEYCWFKAVPSPNGQVLAVPGCLWAYPGEIQFYDFSDPANGWPRLPIQGIDNYSMSDLNAHYYWMVKDDVPIFEYVSLTPEKEFKFRLQLHKDGDVMRGAVMEASAETQARVLKEQRESDQKKAYTQELKATNPQYLALRDAFNTKYVPGQPDRKKIYYSYHLTPESDPDKPLSHTNGGYYSLQISPALAPFVYSLTWKDKRFQVTCRPDEVTLDNKKFDTIEACIAYIKEE